MAKKPKIHTERLTACASKDETRWHLCGVHYDGDYFVSTDGHRLYAVKNTIVQIENPMSAMPDKGIVMEMDPFQRGGHVVPMKEAKYPNWKQFIPGTNYKKPTRVVRTEIPTWLESLKKSKHKGANIGLDLRTPGEARWVIGAVTSEASPDIVYVNPQYIGTVAGDHVDVHFSDSLSPVLITPVDVKAKKWEQYDWIYVVMPMRAPESIQAIVISNEQQAKEPAKEEKIMEGKPVSLEAFRNKKSEEQKQAVVAVEKSKLTCMDEDCGHVHESLEDWDIGADMAASDESEYGEHDSGLYMCKKCGAVQNHGVMDKFVTWTATGDQAGLHAFIPRADMENLLETNVEGFGMRFNPGQAILNAVKTDLIEEFGTIVAEAFPNDFPGHMKMIKKETEKANA